MVPAPVPALSSMVDHDLESEMNPFSPVKLLSVTVFIRTTGRNKDRRLSMLLGGDYGESACVEMS